MQSQKFQSFLAITLGLTAIVLPLILSVVGKETFVYDITCLIPFGILALALNIVVGYTGMLHLGIMAFFAIGAYTTGIAVQPDQYPFHFGLFGAIGLSFVFAAITGVVVGSPTLRLRGDYLALVTVGFGEMIKDTLVNLKEITQGIECITPIEFNRHIPDWLARIGDSIGTNNLMYFVCLFFLIAIYLLLSNVERSRLGRAWIAMREDELAATCMGLNSTRVRLSAFLLCAAIAGIGGSLYAFVLNSTTDPKNTFEFGHSVTVLACVILGGMGNRLGVLMGVLLILGVDQIIIPWVDKNWFQLNTSKMLIYGLTLVLMMRFRPEGILPEQRIAHELHEET